MPESQQVPGPRAPILQKASSLGGPLKSSATIHQGARGTLTLLSRLRLPPPLCAWPSTPACLMAGWPSCLCHPCPRLGRNRPLLPWASPRSAVRHAGLHSPHSSAGTLPPPLGSSPTPQGSPQKGQVSGRFQGWGWGSKYDTLPLARGMLGASGLPWEQPVLGTQELLNGCLSKEGWRKGEEKGSRDPSSSREVLGVGSSPADWGQVLSSLKPSETSRSSSVPTADNALITSFTLHPGTHQQESWGRPEPRLGPSPAAKGRAPGLSPGRPTGCTTTDEPGAPETHPIWGLWSMPGLCRVLPKSTCVYPVSGSKRGGLSGECVGVGTTKYTPGPASLGEPTALTAPSTAGAGMAPQALGTAVGDSG